MSVRRHTVINLAGYVVPLFVLMVTVPLYLKALGEVRYGVLALVWLMLGYFSFLDMGLGKATSNHLSRLHAAPAEDREVVFWTATGVNAGLGILGAVLLWPIAVVLLAHTTSIPPEFRGETSAALPWLIATFPLALVSSVLTGALEGRSRFLAVNVLQVITSVVFQVVPLLIAYACGPSLAYVIPAAVISRASMNIAFFFFCTRYVPLEHAPRMSKPVAKSLLSFGGWVAVTGVSGVIMETADRLLVGGVLGPTAMTHYTIPFQLVGKAKMIPGSLARALFPRFSADTSDEVRRLASASLYSLLAVMTAVAIAGIVALGPFLTLWVGRDISQASAPLGEILLIGIWANSVAHVPYFLLQGTGRPGVLARVQLFEFVPFLATLWAGLHWWGLMGAALVWSSQEVVDSIVVFWLSGIRRGLLQAAIVPASIVGGGVVGIRTIGFGHIGQRISLALLLGAALFMWVWSSRARDLVVEAARRLLPRRPAKPGAR